MQKSQIKNELSIVYSAVSLNLRDSYISIFEKLKPKIHFLLNQLKNNESYPLDLNISLVSYAASEGGFFSPQVSHYWYPTVNNFDTAYRDFDEFVNTVSSVSGNAGVVPVEALVSLRELFDLLRLFEDISAPGKECHVTYTSKSFSHKFKIFLGNDMYEFENVLEVVEELES